MYDDLEGPLVARVLVCLGLDGTPPPSLEGLTRLYRGWCRAIPFDNVRKRIYFGEGGQGALPGSVPAEFFESFLADGTGGTCWSGSGALYALLRTCGFRVRRVAGRMTDGSPPDGPPTHGSVIATVDGAEFLVDSSILSDRPIHLHAGGGDARGHPAWEVRVEPSGSLWQVWWKLWRGRPDLLCRLEIDDVDAAFFAERHEATRSSGGFNQALCARRNTAEGIRLFSRGALTEVDRAGIESAKPAHFDRRGTLIEAFGFSRRVVERVPPDAE